MEFKTFFDIETTGIDPMGDEILTCFMLTEKDGKIHDELDIQMQVDQWGDDAEAASQIHGITKKQMLTFQPKEQGLLKTYHYMKKYPGEYICHANWNNRHLGKYYFDWKFLEMAAHFHSDELYWKFKELFRGYKVTSTHTMVSEAGYKGGKSLDKLCAKLNYEFKHHEAKADVYACREIYKRINEFAPKLIL